MVKVNGMLTLEEKKLQRARNKIRKDTLRRAERKFIFSKKMYFLLVT